MMLARIGSPARYFIFRVVGMSDRPMLGRLAEAVVADVNCKLLAVHWVERG